MVLYTVCLFFSWYCLWIVKNSKWHHDSVFVQLICSNLDLLWHLFEVQRAYVHVQSVLCHRSSCMPWMKSIHFRLLRTVAIPLNFPRPPWVLKMVTKCWRKRGYRTSRYSLVHTIHYLANCGIVALECILEMASFWSLQSTIIWCAALWWHQNGWWSSLASSQGLY